MATPRCGIASGIRSVAIDDRGLECQPYVGAAQRCGAQTVCLGRRAVARERPAGRERDGCNSPVRSAQGAIPKRGSSGQRVAV